MAEGRAEEEFEAGLRRIGGWRRWIRSVGAVEGQGWGQRRETGCRRRASGTSELKTGAGEAAGDRAQ